MAALVRSQAPWMLVAAALFGYFGFYMGWGHRIVGSPPQTLTMVVVLMWALRGGSIAFAIAGVLALVGVPVSLLLYAVAGIATALAFAVVAIWDWSTPQYYSGLHPVILLIFAAWNGFSSVQGVRDWLQMRQYDRKAQR